MNLEVQVVLPKFIHKNMYNLKRQENIHFLYLSSSEDYFKPKALTMLKDIERKREEMLLRLFCVCLLALTNPRARVNVLELLKIGKITTKTCAYT